MKLPERPDLTRLPWQRAARLGPVLAWGAALAVTAWVAADLFWRFSSPRPPALPVASPADPQQAAQAVASRHLMGQGAAAASGMPAPAAPGRYAVQAVVTGSGGRPGWAIIAVDGGPQQGIVEGQEIRPGVTLAAVRSDGVELSVGGAPQKVALAERSAAGGADQPAPPAVNLPAAQPPADFNAIDSGPRSGLPAGFPANIQAQPQPLPNPTNQ